mgnify:CR=1 FL=1
MSTTTEVTSTSTPAARTERRRLFASSYPLIMLIALTILLGVAYLSLITGRYPLELDELFRILGKNWFGMDLKVYKPAENMLLTVRIPHLCRLLVGSDTTKLMTLSILMGASFMMFVDTLARSLTSAEVPLSVLTGFIGTPLYVALLLLGKVRVK